jgi:hypothetical protein
MEIPSTDSDADGYCVDDSVQKKFLENPKFCFFLQERLRKSLSVKVAITLQRPSSSSSWDSNDYIIKLLGTAENKAKTEKAISDHIKILFDTIQSKIVDDDKGL